MKGNIIQGTIMNNRNATTVEKDLTMSEHADILARSSVTRATVMAINKNTVPLYNARDKAMKSWPLKLWLMTLL